MAVPPKNPLRIKRSFSKGDKILYMNLLFVHDCPFYREGDKVFQAGAFPKIIWENNYLPYFEDLTVIGRAGSYPNDKTELSSTDDGRVNFVLITEYDSVKNFFLNYKTIRNKIQKEIEKKDITTVRLPSQFGFTAADILIKAKKPYIVEVVDNAFDSYWYYPSLTGKLGAWYLESVMKRAVGNAAYVYYVSKSLQKDYPVNSYSEVISNVIITHRLSREEIDMTRFNRQTMKIALTGALNVGYKGQDVLLKAVSILDNHIKQNIEFYFTGIGNYDRVIEYAKKLKLSSNIKFIGALPHAELLEQYKNISLYVHPSFKEGLPRVILEAMSMGCPALGSRTAGIPEIINPEYLHRAGDYKKLAAQIKMFYENRKLLEQESYNSLERVVPFLKENMDKKRANFYSRVAKGEHYV
jgi:glycosyltransferase involved in cell wall biosynthesis